MLLQAGADPGVYQKGWNKKLIHFVVKEEGRQQKLKPKYQEDYKELLKWLVDHGESVEDAREDWKRWSEWLTTKTSYEEIGRLRKQEIAERLAREKAEKERGEKQKSLNQDDEKSKVQN